MNTAGWVSLFIGSMALLLPGCVYLIRSVEVKEEKLTQIVDKLTAIQADITTMLSKS